MAGGVGRAEGVRGAGGVGRAEEVRSAGRVESGRKRDGRWEF